MNPYLEQPDVWHDFRCSFFPVATEMLVSQVRPEYIVRLDRRVYRRTVDGVVDEERKSFARIEDRTTREAVTVIELLSPSDKDAEQDRGSYLVKRGRDLSGAAHMVEIDLLRGGRRPQITDRPDCDYLVTVRRAETPSRFELWPFRLRGPLPKIPIPLRAPDPDAVLDLKALLDRVYDAAGYEDYIYSGSPVPPLPPEDRAWGEALLDARRGDAGRAAT